MKQRFKATRVKTTKNFLVVYVEVEVGLSKRFIAVQVPWGLVAEQHREIVEELERLYVKQLEADANVHYLPLEKWE